jgi:hypothetical protein
MASQTLPGPICAVLNTLEIDTGTLCRSVSPVPGSGGLRPPRPAKRVRTTARGGVGKLTNSDFVAAAHSLGHGIDPRLIRAFAEVECGGKSGFGPHGLPVIAFEGHIFRKLTDKEYDEDYPLLSYPYHEKAGPEWRANNKDQKTAWETLNAAMALDKTAALESCSWGMFQVMGFNYEQCGYSDVEVFVAAMKISERKQLDAFVAYCKRTPGLPSALRHKQYGRIAKLYNGRDYGDYDVRIRKAFRKHGGK